jgi:Domain of unknown function (DUF4345)
MSQTSHADASTERGPTQPATSRALRAVFYVGGMIATTAGLHTVITGAKSLPGEGRANSSVESELRFYAAFYVAYGLAALRVAPRADRDTVAVRRLAGALCLAGLARAGAWLTVGRPHAVQQVLLLIELSAPPAVVIWQHAAGRETIPEASFAAASPAGAFSL